MRVADHTATTRASPRLAPLPLARPFASRCAIVARRLSSMRSTNDAYEAIFGASRVEEQTTLTFRT